MLKKASQVMSWVLTFKEEKKSKKTYEYCGKKNEVEIYKLLFIYVKLLSYNT